MKQERKGLHHRRAEWSPHGAVWRIVYLGNRQVCRLDLMPNGAWGFPMEWTGLDGYCTCCSLENAEETIRALYDAFGHNPRYATLPPDKADQF